MKIAWIAPINKKCGISYYAENFYNELSKYIELIRLDPYDFIKNKKAFVENINKCDLVHIQYETSLFVEKQKNYYNEMCNEIKKKKIITLHEIYKTPPFVFPKEKIKGFFLSKIIKQYIWDLRHPHWAEFNKHCKKEFYGDYFLVHSELQKRILIEKGINWSKVETILMPVENIKTINTKEESSLFMLGSMGFINPLYDYELLFWVLERLTFNWRFYWIGGIRRKEDICILEKIKENISKRGWEKRFIITNYVSKDEKEKYLSQLQMYFAFFKDRSSSMSLADAISFQKIIFATKISLIEEMYSKYHFCILCDNDYQKILENILKVINDESIKTNLKEACIRYCQDNNYNNLAHKLINIYKGFLL